MNSKITTYTFTIIFSLLFNTYGYCQTKNNYRDVKFGFNLGYYIPNNTTSSYYNGSSNGPGLFGGADSSNITRILYNKTIKKEIKDALGGYDYTLGELPAKTKYKPDLMVGFIAQYRFSEYANIFVQFNYTKLTTADFFTLITDKYNKGFTSPYYETCNISGVEDRYNIDIGSTIYFYDKITKSPSYPYIELGLNITEVEAVENKIKINNLVYDISNPYNKYYNLKEGGIGIGGFISAGYHIELFKNYSIDIGSSLYISKIALPGYDQHYLNGLIQTRLMFL